MSQKDDLEKHIRESYSLIREYEVIRQDTSSPKEKRRATREIAEQWDMIKEYVTKYMYLCNAFSYKVPQDIVELATAIGFSLPSDKFPKSSTPVELYEMISKYFNDAELQDLAFRLSIEYEDFIAVDKNGKARELVSYCQRHGRFQDLVNIVEQLRPHAF
ncbi:MAG: hypothetical protein IAE79_17255 [Anaerolinea sp.]|nr:hypothetical protein [Anaerolinea sp.]